MPPSSQLETKKDQIAKLAGWTTVSGGVMGLAIIAVGVMGPHGWAALHLAGRFAVSLGMIETAILFALSAYEYIVIVDEPGPGGAPNNFVVRGGLVLADTPMASRSLAASGLSLRSAELRSPRAPLQSDDQLCHAARSFMNDLVELMAHVDGWRDRRSNGSDQSRDAIRIALVRAVACRVSAGSDHIAAALDDIAYCIEGTSLDSETDEADALRHLRELAAGQAPMVDLWAFDRLHFSSSEREMVFKEARVRVAHMGSQTGKSSLRISAVLRQLASQIRTLDVKAILPMGLAF